MTPEKNFREKCEAFLSERHKARAFLAPSCTAALELACLMFVKPGDEVIIPAFSFPSCSNAVILRGGVPVYVDVDPKTLLLDPELVTAAITPRTVALMPLHYAGVDCDTGALLNIARAHDLKVIEDAAQCVGSWELKGDVGAMSFHASKNVECGEGGAVFVSLDNLPQFDALHDCGLGRGPDGERTTWSSVGQSCLLGEPAAAYLWDGLQRVDEVNRARRRVWRTYHRGINARKSQHQGNGHIFWFLSPSDALIPALRSVGIRACSHYEAAHLTGPGLRYGRRGGDLSVSEEVAASIVRLPMNVSEERALEIADVVNEFIGGSDAGIRRVETQASGQAAFA